MKSSAECGAARYLRQQGESGAIETGVPPCEHHPLGHRHHQERHYRENVQSDPGALQAHRHRGQQRWNTARIGNGNGDQHELGKDQLGLQLDISLYNLHSADRPHKLHFGRTEDHEQVERRHRRDHSECGLGARAVRHSRYTDLQCHQTRSDCIHEIASGNLTTNWQRSS